MPETEKKLPNGKYSVSGPHGVHAKGTTKEKADAQVRLLNAVDHGWKPGKKKHRAPGLDAAHKKYAKGK